MKITDVKDIKIDMAEPKEKRIEQFLKQTENPYCVQVGKVIVEMEFAVNGGTMQECVKDVTLKMK